MLRFLGIVVFMSLTNGSVFTYQFPKPFESSRECEVAVLTLVDNLTLKSSVNLPINTFCLPIDNSPPI